MTPEDLLSSQDLLQCAGEDEGSQRIGFRQVLHHFTRCRETSVDNFNSTLCVDVHKLRSIPLMLNEKERVNKVSWLSSVLRE